LRRFAAGLHTPSVVQAAHGERKWLTVYAPLSAAYRLFISMLIVFWVGAQSVVLGVLAGLFVFIAVVLKPAISGVRNMLSAASSGSRGWRARGLVGAATAGLLILLCVVPFPFYTSAPGVVWLPDQAHIRPETEGFVTKIMMRDGAHVEPGEVLLVLEDPLLLANRDKLESQLDGLRADSAKALLRDPLRARNFEQEIERVEGELRRANEKIAQLELRANDGQFGFELLDLHFERRRGAGNRAREHHGRNQRMAVELDRDVHAARTSDRSERAPAERM